MFLFVIFCTITLLPFSLHARPNWSPHYKHVLPQGNIQQDNAISFVTVPRSFDSTRVMQRQLHALLSWHGQQLNHNNQIILMQNRADSITTTIAQSYGWKQWSHLNVSDSDQVPLLDSVLYQIPHIVSHDTVCFINTDITLPPHWTRRILPLVSWARQQRRPFLIAGPRLSLSLSNMWDMTREPWFLFYQRLKQPIPFQDVAIDWFVFDKKAWANIFVPPFRLGRLAWDSWMVHYAVSHDWITIQTMESDVFGVHPEHSRAHQQDTQTNEALAQAHGGYQYGRLFSMVYRFHTNRWGNMSWLQQNYDRVDMRGDPIYQ